MTTTTLTWTELCAADAVEDGAHKAFFIGAKRLCAVNHGGAYHVVDDLCTHGVAYLSEGYLDTDECVLECPLHGGLFSYHDGCPKGDPAEKPVRKYETQVVDGVVMVAL